MKTLMWQLLMLQLIINTKNSVSQRISSTTGQKIMFQKIGTHVEFVGNY